MSNGASLVRLAVSILCVAGAFLPPPTPAAPSPAQRSTLEKEKLKRTPPAPQTPAATPTKPRRPPRTPPQPPAPDPDVVANIHLMIDIVGRVLPRGREASVFLLTSEPGKPLARRKLSDLRETLEGFAVDLDKGLNRRKSYWVTVATADGNLSGEAAVQSPSTDGEVIKVQIKLNPASSFDISVITKDGRPAKGGTVSVVERKGRDAGTPIPYDLNAYGKAAFVKGIDRSTEYEVVTSGGERFPLNAGELKNGKIVFDILLGSAAEKTLVKVSKQSGGTAVSGARVTVVSVSGETHTPKSTDEGGVASFEIDARAVRGVEVEAEGYEKFSCGEEGQAPCPWAGQTGMMNVSLTDSHDGEARSGSGLGGKAVIVLFLILTGSLMFFGVRYFLGTLPAQPYAAAQAPAQQFEAPRPSTSTQKSSGGEAAQATEPSPRPPSDAQQSAAGQHPRHDTTLTADGAASAADSPNAVDTFSVPDSLSSQTAKEAYKRWALREKVSREPTMLDLVLDHYVDSGLLQFRETRDPGSQFILFTDGESNGWLFPNPAPGVLATDVEQTWRLVFKNLSKDEFARKKERLNPLEAHRAASSAGRSVWTAEPREYEFF